MNGLYITSYSVRGIKNIDDWSVLSFYKKTIDKKFSIQEYNVKGIYGANGSGKSAIITSVEILKHLITDPSYLSNSIAQRELDALINKRLETLEICTDFLFCTQHQIKKYHYEITLKKDSNGKYFISQESLSEDNPKSHSDKDTLVFQVKSGELHLENGAEETKQIIIDSTKNLLTNATLSSLYIGKVMLDTRNDRNVFFIQLFILYAFGCVLFVYREGMDDHTAYYIQDYIRSEHLEDSQDMDIIYELSSMIRDKPHIVLSAKRNYVAKSDYPDFEKEVMQLSEFLRLFKNDLNGIRIDCKENKDGYACDLIMDYEDYSIDSEFESTGIKKLIALYVYLEMMVDGSIVFIDELDSNLHDVYLCALLEFLMEYGKGQLCFTTHNIGPMDILRKNKKSIDFLSADHRIVSWKKNGNYSPAKLYKEGMIEGSPFNIFPFDFISAFNADEEQ